MLPKMDMGELSKTPSIPRLELGGALTTTRLLISIAKDLDVPTSNDGSPGFKLNKPPNKWKIYLSNWVAEIQEHILASQWRHISTKLNPADLASRGNKPQELLQVKLWWQGPPCCSYLMNGHLNHTNTAKNILKNGLSSLCLHFYIADKFVGSI